MPMPVKSLPVVQNWDCQGCSDCCREYRVHVTVEEQQRIIAQGWEKKPEYQGVQLFINDGSKRRPKYRLNHRDDDACVFLGPNNRCRIHDAHGSAAKPLACRVYPYMLVPTGDHWNLGLRFACPSATQSLGRPLSQQLHEARTFAALLEVQEKFAGRNIEAPRLQGGQQASWEDLAIFADALSLVLARQQDPIEYRLRKCLTMAKLCRQARFDKITGIRLKEFLAILIGALDKETQKDAKLVPQPTWIGKLLFRQILALYARKDTGQHRGLASRGRWSLFKAAMGFARGTGKVPPVNALIQNIAFEQIEENTTPIPVECGPMLERYFQVKVLSLQFAGTTNFNHHFWDGFESLVLSFPIAVWLSRAFTQMPRTDAVVRGLRIADDSFGFHPLLNSFRQKMSVRILSFRDEIARLVAWYGRV